MDQTAPPAVLWRMRVLGGYAFGFSQTAATGSRNTALTMKACKDLRLYFMTGFGVRACSFCKLHGGGRWHFEAPEQGMLNLVV